MIQIYCSQQMCVSSSEIPPPIAFWPLNSTYGFKDHKNVFKTTATEVTLIKGPCGVPATAVQFTKAKQSRLFVEKHQSLILKGSFSVCAMVFVKPGVIEFPLVRYDSKGTQFRVNQANLDLNIATTPSLGEHSIAPIAVVPGLWTFVAVSYNAETGDVIFVINGKENAQKSLQNLKPHSNYGMWIGQFGKSGLDGALAMLRMFDVALTAKELRSFWTKCREKGRYINVFSNSLNVPPPPPPPNQAVWCKQTYYYQIPTKSPTSQPVGRF
jgi:hypothetical protein